MKAYNVIFDKNTDFEQFSANMHSSGANINLVFQALGVINVSSASLEFTNVPGVLGFEEDLSITPEESFEWHQLRLVNPTLPMSSYYTAKNFGTGVKVYVIDSGVDASHSEFSHTTINNLYSYDGDFTPSNGHGTGVASLIVGETLGVSPESSLYNLKVPTGTQTTISVLLAAFNSIVETHDANSVGVVNCSWTIPKSEILDNKIIELQNHNLVVVAAAGNTKQAADNFSPVGLNSVLGVGAMDSYDRVISWTAGAGSNWGPEVDIFAPGIDVTCATLNNEFFLTSGTSLAAAVASGVVAQYIVENPNLSSAEIQSLIISSSIPDLLFRDESLYGTTPNAILNSPQHRSLFTNLPLTGIEVKLGETTNFELQYMSQYISTIEVDFIKSGIHYALPDWITVSGNLFTFSPPANLPSGFYNFWISAKDAEQNHVVTRSVTTNVYHLSPEENNLLEKESYYFKMNEDSEVVLVLASCSSGNAQCTGVNIDCFGGKGVVCFCVGTNNCITEQMT